LEFLSFGEQDRRNLVEVRDVISSRVEGPTEMNRGTSR